jgi:hypothetical protein
MKMDFTHLSPENIVKDPYWIIIQVIIAIVICMALGKVHEYLHMRKAKQLGYAIKSFKWFRNETDVDIQPDDPNVRKIAYAPYIVLVPTGWLLFILGFVIDSFGIFLGGIGTLVIHGLSLGKEGKS